MVVEKLRTGPLKVNTYIIIENNKAVVVDPGGNYNEIMKIVGNNKCVSVLLTHFHFDHIGAVKDFINNKIPVYLNKDDEFILDEQKSYANHFNLNIPNNLNDLIDINDGEILNLLDSSIEVITTPGHTPGCVTYKINNYLFTGDTLFHSTYGRVDLSGGSYLTIKDSIINKLFKLKGDYKIFPGHEMTSTLNYERQHNDILY